MYIIVGLGNPTSKYDGTRHNIGFEVITRIAKDYNISLDTIKHKAIVGAGYIEGVKVLLVKPQTYMNNSGESVRAILDFYKLTTDDLLVIYDDISLEVGKLRLRLKGSAGGQNGVKSIISHLGTDVFPRIKVGVGAKPEGWDLADYVLSRFTKDEEGIMGDTCKTASEAVKMIVSEDFNKAMNQFNKK